MTQKTINTRVVNKHDTEANWVKATNFTPKQGEIIVYDIDSTHTYERFKIGDGKTKVNDLPFAMETYVAEQISAAPQFYVQEATPVDAPLGSLWIDTSVTSASQI